MNGSDIKNLDCCIFLDNVKSRSAKLFVQSIGRVLRLDKNNSKKYGLVIDLKNKSSINIMTKINKFLCIKNDIFPWKYTFDYINLNKNLIKINTLEMVKNNLLNTIENENINKNYNINDLKNLFVREIPIEDIYIKRLNEELELIFNKKLINHLIQSVEILNITKNIPHVTRGSCGSSLICYLLGITHIDPIKYDIKFARFLNEHRDNLPDIDLDFPHKFRDEVFFQLENRWCNKIARISNKVHYHDKSALRQAIRNAGIHKFISKYELNNYIKNLPSKMKNFIRSEKKKLEETFKCFSLHCGGIVYFPNGIPSELLLKSDKIKILNQIILDKNDIARNKTFKIDILSSRALSQLYEIYNLVYKSKNIDFSEYKYDKKTYDLLSNGDNIGITLCESPLMRLALIKIKPKSIYDIAVCLAIIRPAASGQVQSESLNLINSNFAKVNQNSSYDSKNIIKEKQLIFDDDAIDIISNILNISYSDADKYRRFFIKNNIPKIIEFKKLIAHLTIDEQKNLLNKLNKLSAYGFCKAHALSYAQLVYKLAYMKAHHPKEFWQATLNNCESSYKKWVHLHEAAQYDVYPKNDKSIYALNRQKKINNLSFTQQLLTFGYWIGKNFYQNCYFYNIDSNNNSDKYNFNGIIASIRLTKYKKY